MSDVHVALLEYQVVWAYSQLFRSIW